MNQEDIDRVIYHLRKIITTYEDREDLAISILMTSWLNGFPKPSQSYIRNKAIDFLRKKKRHKDHIVAYQLTLTEELRTDNIAEIKPLTEDLLKMLTKILTREERTTIWYYYYLELPMREIAARTNSSLAQVSRTIHDALKKMRDYYEKEVKTTIAETVNHCG